MLPESWWPQGITTSSDVSEDGLYGGRRAIDIHAGGMFLYGPYLYVADTEKGFRIFDMRYIFSATGSNDAAIGRDAAGSTTPMATSTCCRRSSATR